MLKKELAAMERRNQEAEARHEELTGKLPDTTRPLLRQIEGMQRTAAAHAQAWQAAEQSLQQRLSEAESQAANAGHLLVFLAWQESQIGKSGYWGSGSFINL